MEFKLPEIGEGVHEGELIRWLVKEGDTVQADQALLEVMTDKATVEVPSPGAGTIKGITAKDGQMIKVGQVLAQITGDAAAAKSAEATKKEQPPKQGEAKQQDWFAAPPQQGASAVPEAKPAPQAPAAQPQSGQYAQNLAANNAGSVPAAPIVRAMAQQSGIDLSQVPASGPAVGGTNRVLEKDLMNFLNQGTARPTSAPQSNGGTAPAKANKPALAIPRSNLSAPAGQEVERKPLRGLRRVISQAMVRSKFTAPHYSYVDKFECSKLVELREHAKVAGEKYGVKITYLPFIIKALVGALKEFPECNSSLEEKGDQAELVIKKFYNIGFAVATKDGLLVPVIKNADRKSLIEIAAEMAEASEKTRNGKASADELKGSTFTITSMGNIGGLFATPIINYPEAGILGVYKVQEEPIVQDGQIVIGKTMHLSLSLDHRIIDGAVGGHFCNAIIERLADPGRMLLEMI